MLNKDKMPFDLSGQGWEITEAKPSAFDGGTVDARGDIDGAGNPLTLFTVTGDVLVRVFGVVDISLVGATGTVEVGVTGNTAGLIAQTLATDLVGNEIWGDATPTEVGAGLLSGILGPYIVANGLDIIETVATANITAGKIRYFCMWRPLSGDGKVIGS